MWYSFVLCISVLKMVLVQGIYFQSFAYKVFDMGVFTRQILSMSFLLITKYKMILTLTSTLTFCHVLSIASSSVGSLKSKFERTRSYVALWAAGLGLSGQDAFAQWHSFDPKNVTWQTRGPTEWESDHFLLPTRGHNWPSWHTMRKWSFFVTHAGSQLTF